MSKRNQLRNIESLLERIDAAIVVRDLGNARSADAFDGLRKSSLVATKSRRTHISHLVSLDESIRNGGSLDLVKARLAEYLNELGIERLTDLRHLECFDVVGDSAGDIEILEPAVVERADDGKLTILRVGKAQRTTKLVVDEGGADRVADQFESREPLLEDEEDSGQPVEGHGRIVLRSDKRFSIAAIGVLVLSTILIARSCGNDESKQEINISPTTVSSSTTMSTIDLQTTTTTTIG